MAFVFAGLVFIGTLLYCLLIMWADSMSDAPSEDGISVLTPFLIGMIITVVLVISHWSPHIPW
jgi:hypothetical protein